MSSGDQQCPTAMLFNVLLREQVQRDVMAELEDALISSKLVAKHFKPGMMCHNVHLEWFLHMST